MNRPNNVVEFQREVAGLVSRVTEDLEYALAGSSALREHGVIERRTMDVDMFTSLELALAMEGDGSFVELVVDPVRRAAEAAGIGCEVDYVAEHGSFAKMRFSRDGISIEADIGADVRTEPPVQMEFGKVIAKADSVGSKLSAVFGRSEPRDYYDVWKAVEDLGLGFWDMVGRVAVFDAGIEGCEELFLSSLRRGATVSHGQLADYGIGADEVEEMHAFYERAVPEWRAELERGRVG